MEVTSSGCPFVIVDSTRKVKNVTKANVNDTFFVKNGMSPIPVKTNESVYLNASDNVPMAWKEDIARYIQDPQLNATARNRFCINSNGMNWRTLHLMVHLIRTHATTLSYDTHGYIDKKTGHVAAHHARQFYTKEWKPLHDYHKLLNMVEAVTGEKRAIIYMTDFAIRHRRVQIDPSFLITTKDDCSFCYINFINDEGFMQYSWIDVTPSTTRIFAQIQPPLPLLVDDQYLCRIEGCGINKDLLQCSRCKKVFYCSVSHQREDWSSHKLQCK